MIALNWSHNLTTETGEQSLETLLAMVKPEDPKVSLEKYMEETLQDIRDEERRGYTEASTPKSSQLSKKGKSLLTEIKSIQQVGYQEYALCMGKSKSQLRGDLLKELDPFMCYETGINFIWGEWDAKEDPSYQTPECVARLSELLELFVFELAILHYLSDPYSRCGRANAIMEVMRASDCIMVVAEEQLQESVKQAQDAHQWVHIQEVYTTFCTTLLQLVESVLAYPEKLLTDTQPRNIEFTCSGKLAGLIMAPFPFVGPDERVRPPAEPNPQTDRRGREVSFEEISNIYRTTRVSISNIVQKGHMLMAHALRGDGILDEAAFSVSWQDENEEVTGLYDDIEAHQFMGSLMEEALNRGLQAISVGSSFYYREDELERFAQEIELDEVDKDNFGEKSLAERIADEAFGESCGEDVDMELLEF